MIRYLLILFFVLSGVSTSTIAASIYSSDTFTKKCGSSGVYAGPNRADLHGGVCLSFHSNHIGNGDGQFQLHTSYTLDKTCDDGGVYVGPNKPQEHGGTCLWADGYTFSTQYVQSQKKCSFGRAYVGPYYANYHGGYCVWVNN